MSRQAKQIQPIRNAGPEALRNKMQKALEEIERVAYTDPELAREIYNERREAALKKANLHPDLSSKAPKRVATAQPGDGSPVNHRGFSRPVDTDGNQIPVHLKLGLIEIVNQCKSIGFPLDQKRLADSVITFVKAEMDAYDPTTSQSGTTLATEVTTAHSTKRPHDGLTDDQKQQSGTHIVKRARSLTSQGAAENPHIVGTVDLTMNDDGIYADLSSGPLDTTVGTRSSEIELKTGSAMLLNEQDQIPMLKPSASQQFDAGPNIGLPLRAGTIALTAHAPPQSTFNAGPKNLALASSDRGMSTEAGSEAQEQLKAASVAHRSGLSSSYAEYNSTSSTDPALSAGAFDDPFSASSQEEKAMVSVGDRIEEDAVRMKAHMS